MTRLVVLLALLGCVVVTPAPGSSALRVLVIGRSSEGRPIEAIEVGDSAARVKLLVVGCIHGNEQGGIAIARRLEQIIPPPGIDLWIVPVLNPDGVAADTRQNAHGVDLNRNFPWRWRDLEGIYDSGSRPLSEPEVRAAARLILRVRPTISIWYHQHLDLVDESGGSLAIERRYARLAGLPLQRLVRDPGSVVNWENHVLPRSTAFVVELPAGRLSRAATERHARAVLALAGRR